VFGDYVFSTPLIFCLVASSFFALPHPLRFRILALPGAPQYTICKGGLDVQNILVLELPTWRITLQGLAIDHLQDILGTPNMREKLDQQAFVFRENWRTFYNGKVLVA